MNSPTSVLPISDDAYAFQHLSYHLFQAGLGDKLYHLVLSREWYQQSAGFDPSGWQYGEDIRRAFQATVGQIETNLFTNYTGTLGTFLARPAVLAWLSASFGQTAKLLSIPVLEAMTRLGDVEQANRRAEMMPDPVRRAEAFIRIGEAAFALGRYMEAQATWTQAQELLLSTPTDLFNEKLEALGQLTRVLVRAGMIGEASTLAVKLQAEVEDETKQAGGVTSAAHIALASAWGAIGEKEKALTAVRSLIGTRDKILAFCAAAEGLLNMNQAQALAVLDMALNLVVETGDKTALSRLALRLAEADRLSDAWQVAGDTNDIDLRSRIFLAAAKTALRQGDTTIGESLLAEAIQAAVTAGPKERLLFLAEIASAGHLIPNEKITANLLNLIKGRWQEFATEWDSRALGILSLGLLALGDAPEAEATISTALNLRLPNDDWEENDALGELAGKLGEVGDSDGLAWILTLAKERQTAWQQAELAYHVARAATETGDTALTNEAEQLMEAAALGKTEAISGANARGILAVWKANKQDMTTAQQLVKQAIAQLKEDPDCADALAYLALTLAHGRVPELASYVLQQTIDVLQQEFDPNMLARAIGTAAEVAATLDDSITLHLLKTTAKTIDDDWLQAEALFWIAGWQAVLGDDDEARQTYMNAAVSGTWQPLDPTDIKEAWNDSNIDWIVEIAQDVGWPSTTAAAIFAGMALAMAKPQPGWIEDGLLAIDQITEGYNHIRAICHHLLLKAATQLSEQPVSAIKYWENALEYNRGRDIGEAWAVVGACLPIFYRQFGQSFVTSLWQELARARRILT